MENNYDLNAPKIELPNATVVLVLGIVSIPTCCCYGIVGIVCGIVALILAKSASNLYASDPGRYTEGSYKNMNAGRICALIGIVLSVIFIIYMITIIAKVGMEGLSDPSILYQRLGIPAPQQ